MIARQNESERGFSLTELMIVVVLIGVLAMLAFPALRRRIEQARGRLGTIEMRAIAAAQERFRAENLVYLDVSPSLTAYFPVSTPSPTFRLFRDTNQPLWEVLGPSITEATPYVFASRAGLSGEPLPPDIDAAAVSVMPPSTFPVNANSNQWYVIQGVGDLDGDGVRQVMFSSSFDPTLYVANEGE